MRYQKLLFGSLMLMASSATLGHGLMSEPASRNWFCGAVTKPDQAEPGSACAEAFEDDFNGGYQFMSVLTHDLGRAGVSPLPNNVCGFDSETWDGGATPWDKPIDWPTNDISPGTQTITWDISWGPHFDDTEEFHYYITKPGFQYQVGVPLTWDDFESEPFCDLTYDDSNPNANPNVVADKGSSLFHTTCTIPERSGRHVIYGEWGRNQWTYERFHGCIDVEFGGGSGAPPVVADIVATPSNSTFTGSGEIALDGTSSQGENLSYQWSLEAADESLYSLSSTSSATTVLTLGEPQSTSDVTVRLQVSNGSSTSVTSTTFTHTPEAGASWEDLGALNADTGDLTAGDEVQLRLVDDQGNDTYYPSSPLVITDQTASASSWTYALAQAVNSEAGGDVRVGALDGNGDVEPVQSATANRVYAAAPSSFSSAFVQVESNDDDNGNGGGSANCSYQVESDWGSGFVANITITNDGDTAIDGWNVEWSYSGNTQVGSAWNANLSGSNPYSASNVDWNGRIEPGQSVSFGFQGTGSAGNPEVTGSVCN